MVKHTQTIRRQFAYEFFECVGPICEIGALQIIGSANHWTGFYMITAPVMKELKG